ncbi:MAG TPA: 3-deoxy-8-phosphooctulonate synthase, partial [Dissulfurispiraceae bacterium]|nr:3-deoxy-8-phosphooctulonate synthase [Dissulfurispiraceae bacterium]
MKLHVGGINTDSDLHPLIIAGPCVIEDEGTVFEAARRLKEIADRLQVPLVFKSSYDKANRTSVTSFRGPGIEKGLRILADVRSRFGLPVISDVHTVEEVGPAGEVLDMLQLPAFLSRQTDLIVAAAKTGKPVNIKKGQFLAPWDVKNIIDKFVATGNTNLFLTERGTLFGYNNLVVDFRSFPILRSFGFPVIFDVTHSLQLPGGQGTSSGGQREFAAPLAKAAAAAG